LWICSKEAKLGLASLVGRIVVANGRCQSTAALLLSLAIPISFANAWFIQQTSWERVDPEFAKWRNWPSKPFFVGTAIKLVIDVIFVSLTTRHFVSVGEAIRIVSTWSVLVIAAAFASWAIWPATHLPNLEVPFTTVLMSAVLVSPPFRMFRWSACRRGKSSPECLIQKH